MMRKKLSILVVDDSPIVRKVLVQIFSADPQLEVIDAVEDPFMAAESIKRQVPDVITLDIEMPRMDGLTFLKKIMQQHPIPVVIISSLTKNGTVTAMKALEYGAVEVIEKPKMSTPKLIEEASVKLCDIVKAASSTKLKRNFKPMIVQPKFTADAILPRATPRHIPVTDKIISVGASTGGTEAIRIFLEQMPVNSPGIIIVQHMPEKFTNSFAERLNQLCKIEVKEAENGDVIRSGLALIAPGNSHALVKRNGNRYYVEILNGQLVNRHRPSVDVLFRSTANSAGSNALGIIMTGMGDDGARGLGEMKEAGAYTIAQDEKSSIVYGMPKEALKYDLSAKVIPLNDISKHVIAYLRL